MKAATGLLAVLLMLSSTSLAQTAPTQPTAPDQQSVTGGDAAKPEAAKPEAAIQASTPSTSPSADTAPTEAAAASEGAVPATAFAPGAKVFLEPMGGFEELLSHELVKQKVPVVLVQEREKADFVMSGEARLKQHGWLAGNVLYPHGRALVSIKDAHTGNQVFVYDSHRVDSNETAGEIYKIWAGSCATRLKKEMKKEVKQEGK